MKNRIIFPILLILLLIFNFFGLFFMKYSKDIFPWVNILFLIFLLINFLIHRKCPQILDEIAHKNYKTYLKIPYLVLLLENVDRFINFLSLLQL